jgi:hypothetical protein
MNKNQIKQKGKAAQKRKIRFIDLLRGPKGIPSSF